MPGNDGAEAGVEKIRVTAPKEHDMRQQARQASVAHSKGLCCEDIRMSNRSLDQRMEMGIPEKSDQLLHMGFMPGRLAGNRGPGEHARELHHC